MAVNLKTFLGANKSEGVGRANVLAVIRKKFGKAAAQDVDNAISRARKAGVSWLEIFGVLLPLILKILTGNDVDILEIIDAILDLFQ